MGQLFEALSPRHVAFIEAQKIFFVGTAAATSRRPMCCNTRA